MFQDRNIFSFHDGSAVVHIDPLAAYRQLAALLGQRPGQLVEAINAARPATATAEQLQLGSAATEQLVASVRQVFGLPELDRATGRGATEAHCLGVYAAFAAFLAKKKQTAATSLTSPTPSDGPSIEPITAPTSA